MLHCKNPFQISFADGILPSDMFPYGQSSKCADLLNSYKFCFYFCEKIHKKRNMKYEFSFTKSGLLFPDHPDGIWSEKNWSFKPVGSSGLLEARHEDHTPGSDHP